MADLATAATAYLHAARALHAALIKRDHALHCAAQSRGWSSAAELAEAVRAAVVRVATTESAVATAERELVAALGTALAGEREPQP